MVPPRVALVPRGTFRAWTRERGRLGGQNKVPRLRNDREVADALLAATLDRLWQLRVLAASGRSGMRPPQFGREAGGVSFPPPAATLTHGAGRSGEIETIALAALALAGRGERLHQTRPLIETLVAAKDSRGAWHSTQATILSLRAILAHQRTAQPPRGTLEVLVDGRPQQRLRLDGVDRVHHLALAEAAATGEHRVTLRFAGRGAAQYQLVARYWEPRSGEQPAGALAISTALDRARLRTGQAATLAVQIANRSQRAIPMPLVSVGLPPGLELDPEALGALVRARQIEKAQHRGDHAVLYLGELPARRTLRFTLRLDARFPLRVQARPSSVYEYYQPEHRAESRPLRVEVL